MGGSVLIFSLTSSLSSFKLSSLINYQNFSNPQKKLFKKFPELEIEPGPSLRTDSKHSDYLLLIVLSLHLFCSIIDIISLSASGRTGCNTRTFEPLCTHLIPCDLDNPSGAHSASVYVFEFQLPK